MRDGAYELQSALYYDPATESFLVGTQAYRKGLIRPENLALGVKRHMDEPSSRITIGGRDFTPVELSARILSGLHSNVAEKFPKGLFRSRGTVVTVPYYFKAHQCEATRRAAESADIACIGILPEPISASFAYAWDLVRSHPGREAEETILVFDLGGGTFDLTLFRLIQQKDRLIFEVLGSGGDDRLGGMDFDSDLMGLLLEKSGLSLDGLPVPDERKATQKLLAAALEAKITLSSEKETYVTVPYLIGEKNLETTVSRGEFDELLQPHVEKIERIIEGLWISAGSDPSKLDRVIRVGGSSRIPRMRDLLNDLAGEEKVFANVNPSWCVAEGAAIYAAHLDDPEMLGREVEVRARTCHALGVETAGGRFHALIPANRKTPCEHTQLFTNDEENGSSLDIHVYQGSSLLVKDNALIGTIHVPDLPKAGRDELDVMITFGVSADQRLSVLVKARNPGQGDWAHVSAGFQYA